MRRALVMLAALLLCSATAHAEWQFKPFVAGTFAGSSNYFADLEAGSNQKHLGAGVTTVKLGDVFGIEADVAHVPRFFNSSDSLGQSAKLVTDSSVTTVTGNLVVAFPRRLTEYTLRPYVAAGGGLMRARIDDYAGSFAVSSNLAAWDVGVGVTGFLTDRLGVSWDARYFRSVGGPDQGLSLGGPEQLAFWRVNMALAIRY